MRKQSIPWMLMTGVLIAGFMIFGAALLNSGANVAASAAPVSAARQLPVLPEDDGEVDGPLPAPSVTRQQTAVTLRPRPTSSPRPPTLTPTLTTAPTLNTSPQMTAPPTLTALPTLSAALWKEWPVLPEYVSAELRLRYQSAIAQGRINSRAFSVFGDCQSEAEAFLGVFDSSPGLVETMSADRREIVAQFQGSFLRYNPAAKSGSSAGSLLYAPWNDNKAGQCLPGETPADCELRVHQPSLVFIHLGTHFETKARNFNYLSVLIEKVLATGAVPVLVTKADNLEQDERATKTWRCWRCSTNCRCGISGLRCMIYPIMGCFRTKCI